MPRAETSALDMGGVPAERVVAHGVPPGRAMLLVHGGAFAVGTPALYRGLAARLSRAARCAVYVPGYRLAPEHPFPAALEDVHAAWRWLSGRVDPARLAVLGDSAGGCLALALLAGADDVPRPAAGVGLAPWSDLTCSGASIVANAESDAYLVGRLLEPVAALYLAGADPHDPRASPLLGRHDRLPPLLLQVSDSEVLLDDTLRLAAAVEAAGGSVRVERWRGLPHVFQLFAPLLPQARDAIERVGAFVGAAWEGMSRR